MRYFFPDSRWILPLVLFLPLGCGRERSRLREA